MTDLQFRALVVAMRLVQRDYFVTRDGTALAEAKRLEGLVDRELRSEGQRDLPGFREGSDGRE